MEDIDLGMKRILSNVNSILYDAADPRIKELWIFYSPVTVFLIVVAYIVFSLKLGPKFMENRAPIKLERIMIVYNTFQSIANLYLCIVTFGITFHEDYTFPCAKTTGTSADFDAKVISTMNMYIYLKFLDLADTMFMILKKNYHQVTFLHVYHHTLMVIFPWVCGRYIPSAQGVFFGILNCFVHTVMYFYYLVTALSKNKNKSLWWKKYLTQLQLAQFVLTGIQTIAADNSGSCTGIKMFLYAGLSQLGLMMFLFTKFYRTAYLGKKEPPSLIEAKKEI